VFGVFLSDLISEQGVREAYGRYHSAIGRYLVQGYSKMYSNAIFDFKAV
jgi:hypothetical protein